MQIQRMIFQAAVFRTNSPNNVITKVEQQDKKKE